MTGGKAFCDIIMKRMRPRILEVPLYNGSTREVEARGSRPEKLCLENKNKNRTGNQTDNPYDFSLDRAVERNFNIWRVS